MIRYRLASVAFAAGLGLLQGCSTSGSCSSGYGGTLLQRMGFGRHEACECSTVGSGGVIIDGGSGPGCQGPGCQGPYLEPQGPSAVPPFSPVPGGEPPMINPTPRPMMPQAQPTPAGPVSKVKTVEQGQK